MGDSVSVIEDLTSLYELLASMVEASGVPPRDETIAPGQFFSCVATMATYKIG
jgi:hypothetical protein